MSRYFDSIDSILKPMPTLADSLRDRIADLERQHKTLREENARIKSQNKVLLDENARLKNRVETHNRRDAGHLNIIKTLEEENKKLVIESAQLRTKIDEKDTEINSLKRMNRNLAASNEALQKLAYKPTTKPVTTDDLLKKLQNDKPKPKMSEEDKKTITRFKELMGDVSGCGAEEIVSRFLGTCLTMAIEDEFKD